MSSILSSLTTTASVSSMSAAQVKHSDWSVECSDDESYASIGTKRQVNGTTVWEVNGKQMAFLYQQLEKTGCMDLRWQCPGRRSPSVHSVVTSIADKKPVTTETTAKTPVVTEFDFDEEFADTNAATTKPTAITNRRKTGNQTSSKKVAKLEKVMHDMKRYQIIDQQTRQE